MSHQRGAKTKKNKKNREVSLAPKTKLHSNLRPKQSKSKSFLKPYYPYLPLLVILLLIVSIVQPWRTSSKNIGVLAYATNVSPSGLLDSTNEARSKNNKKPLKINSRLTKAAQAKAEDMTRRNYWSHDTPDGKTPWTFVNKFNYKYKKAGENLAYGFFDSSQVVSGWLNSPSHKENVLDENYSEVGFGYANSSDYLNEGPTTVVVALYAKPEKGPVGSFSTTESRRSTGYNTTLGSKTSDAENVNITRLQVITGANYSWLKYVISFVLGGISIYLLLKHGNQIRKMISKGERYIVKNPLFDVTLISLIVLCLLVSQKIGVIL